MWWKLANGWIQLKFLKNVSSTTVLHKDIFLVHNKEIKTMSKEVIFTTYFLNTLFWSTLFKTKSSGSSGRNTYQSDTYQLKKMQEKTFSSPLSSHYGQTLEKTDQTKACIVVNFILTYLISFFILTQLFYLDTNFPDAKKKWQ